MSIASGDELDWLDEDKEKRRQRLIAERAEYRAEDPLGRSPKPKQLIEAEGQLTAQQRLLKDLIACTKSSRQAYEAFHKTYPDVDRSTLWRWRQTSEFAKALALTYDHLCNIHGVSRESLVHRLEQIREDALDPKPILFKGRPTGYYENNPQHALKAIEQQSKLLKLYDEERSNVQVNLQVDFGSYGEPEPVIEGEAVEVEEPA